MVLNNDNIIDDMLNEATEGFVMVLLTNVDNNVDVLRFNIFDDDGD